jgi:hypothetical protein
MDIVGDADQIAQFVRHLPKGIEPMLIANQISADVLHYLDKHGICFLSLTDGQARYIAKEPRPFRYLEGERMASGEAMARLIFSILNQPETLSLTQREISARAGIALGTVSWGLRDLVAANYLLKQKRGYHLNPNTTERLVRHWADVFETKVRPKYAAGYFRLINSALLEKLPSTLSGRVQFGGELALPYYLKGAHGDKSTQIIYINGELKNITRELNLVRDESAKDRFLIVAAPWTIDPSGFTLAAPRLTVYADLAFSKDSRLHEIAETILKKQILPDLYGS